MYTGSNIFQAPIRATLSKVCSVGEPPPPAFRNLVNFGMGAQCHMLITASKLNFSKFCHAKFLGVDLIPKPVNLQIN